MLYPCLSGHAVAREDVSSTARRRQAIMLAGEVTPVIHRASQGYQRVAQGCREHNAGDATDGDLVVGEFATSQPRALLWIH